MQNNSFLNNKLMAPKQKPALSPEATTPAAQNTLNTYYTAMYKIPEEIQMAGKRLRESNLPQQIPPSAADRLRPQHRRLPRR